MNFFEEQEKARKRSGLLVFYFILGVCAIVAAIYLAVAFGLKMGHVKIAWTRGLFEPGLFAAVAGASLLIILSATLWKSSQMGGKKSGERVALLMGGQLVPSGTSDPYQRRLLNVVEEMAIASGSPVPPVYILEDDSINAFAAGQSASDAVIAVTRGTMTMLSREELQGVVAHEFSHIFNGDMRLNLRLVGIVFGILVISLIGMQMLRLLRFSGRSRSDKGGGYVVFFIVLVGIVFMVVGWIGHIFSSLIQMAVSRQREYLADASAVQFTRNPNGIAGALKKIGGFAQGSVMTEARANEIAHLFFANGIKSSFSALFSTHPPLVNRIRKIDPEFDGKFPDVKNPAPPAKDKAPGQAAGFASAASSSAGIVSSVASPTARHLKYAGQINAGIPESLSAASSDPYSSRLTILGLLLDPDEKVRSVQTELLAKKLDKASFFEFRRILPDLLKLKQTEKLPLAAKCLPSLRSLSPVQASGFRKLAEELILADAKVSMFEFCVRRMLSTIRPSGPTVVRSGKNLETLAAKLLSAVAWAGASHDRGKAGAAFQSGAKELKGIWPGIALRDEKDISAAELDVCLDSLMAKPPATRMQFFIACVQCVVSDEKTTPEEAELIRAMAVSLEIPLPPMLDAA